MANWLDKYEQGGLVLKKKTKDNYGKKANPNDVKASVGPDFVGLGYNTKGRDYSPAWGGQFRMGGSMPGAVGFTYARVAGSAPANGKYTKKTKASAQDGKKVDKTSPNEKKYQASDKKEIINWFNNYYASPLFKENLYNKGLPDEGTKVGKETTDVINKLNFTYNDLDSLGNPDNTAYDSDKTINITNPNKYWNQSKSAVLAHELAHVNQDEILSRQPRHLVYMLNRNKNTDRHNEANRVFSLANQKPANSAISTGSYRLSELKDWAQGENRGGSPWMHDDRIGEVRSDVMALRYLAAKEGIWDAVTNKPGSFTPEMLDKLYKSKELNTPMVTYDKYGATRNIPSPESLKPNDLKKVAPPKKPGMILERLRKRYRDSELLNLMNWLAKNEDAPPMDQAQNGTEMKFYQEGLDFKPKTISKNGSVIKDDRGTWLDKYAKQYSNVQSDNIPTTASVQKKTMERVEYDQQKAIQAARDKQGYIEKAGPKQSTVSKTWSILTNPMTALSYKIKGKELPDNFEKGPRNVLDYAVDFINPYGVVDAASNIPGDLSRGDFGAAALNTLAAFPALHETGVLAKAAKTTGQLSKAKNLKEATAYLTKGIPVEKSLPRLAEGELKTFRQLQEIPKMYQAGKSRADQMRYAIENNIPDTHFERIFEMPKKKAQELLDSGFGERPAVDREALRNRFRQLDEQQLQSVSSPSVRSQWINEINEFTENPYFGTRIEPAHDFYQNLGHRTVPTSYDQMTDSEIEALRDHLFDRQMVARRERIANENSLLGDDLDIDRDFIDMSTAPNEPEEWIYFDNGREIGRSSDPNIDRDYFLNRQRTTNKSNIGDRLTKVEKNARGKINNLIQNATQSYPYYSGEVQERVPSLFRSQEKSLRDVASKVSNQARAGDIPSGTVYTGSLNTSHNSWLPQVKQVFNYEGGAPQFTGYKPMNSLGYLSQARVPEEDIIKYLNSEMDDLIKRGKLPKDVQRPMMYKEHPMLPQYAIKQFREGGIVDSRGQWEYPGEITTIPGNDITMKGVNYDVLGVSNTGDKKLMKPGKNYKFDGDYVTEYPKGGWLNKYK